MNESSSKTNKKSQFFLFSSLITLAAVPLILYAGTQFFKKTSTYDGNSIIAQEVENELLKTRQLGEKVHELGREARELRKQVDNLITQDGEMDSNLRKLKSDLESITYKVPDYEVREREKLGNLLGTVYDELNRDITLHHLDATKIFFDAFKNEIIFLANEDLDLGDLVEKYALNGVNSGPRYSTDTIAHDCLDIDNFLLGEKKPYEILEDTILTGVWQVEALEAFSKYSNNLDVSTKKAYATKIFKMIDAVNRNGIINMSSSEFATFFGDASPEAALKKGYTIKEMSGENITVFKRNFNQDMLNPSMMTLIPMNPDDPPGFRYQADINFSDINNDLSNCLMYSLTELGTIDQLNKGLSEGHKLPVSLEIKPRHAYLVWDLGENDNNGKPMKLYFETTNGTVSTEMEMTIEERILAKEGHFFNPLTKEKVLGQAYLNKGISLHENGSIYEALNYYTKAIEVNPDDVIAYAKAAHAFIELEKYAEAKPFIKKAYDLGFSFVK